MSYYFTRNENTFKEVWADISRLLLEEGVDEGVVVQLKEKWLDKLIKYPTLFDPVNKWCSPEGLVQNETLNAVCNEEPVLSQIDGTSDGEDSTSQSSNDTEYDTEHDTEDNEAEQSLGIDGEAPLNSGDDLTDEDEDTDNIIVCMYTKVWKQKNIWKMDLCSGVMNLEGKESVFRTAHGQAKW